MNPVEQAMMLQRSGDAAGAAAIYRRVLKTAPGDAQLTFLLGLAELQLGNAKEAASLIEKSVRIRPNPTAYCNLGLARHRIGRHAEAVADFDRAIALNPHYAIAYNNRGSALLALGRRDDALDSYGRAIAIEPRYAGAHNNRGGLFREMGETEKALGCFDQAVMLEPGFAIAHLNRGMALNDLSRPEQALASFDRALAIDSSLAAAHCGRATALFGLKRLDEAEASNERALALLPDFAEARWNRALFALTRGDLTEGWKHYEARWELDEWRRVVAYSGDRTGLWLGQEDIAGKTVLVRSEQGFGDVVQFCRYAPMLRARGARVILEAKKRLLPLLATLDREIVLVESGQAVPEHDYFCPVLSLPLAFGTTIKTVPADVPYLFADDEKRRICEARLGERTAPRIGLVWSGNPKQSANPVRSLPLAVLQPLLQQPFAFHCLQKEIAPGDRAALATLPVALHDEEQSDFSDAAALIAGMDLVITVDTVVAHVAGALGRPVWILLPWMADWRWMQDRSDSPWYPSARLFRQKARGDWAGVIAEVAGALNAPA